MPTITYDFAELDDKQARRDALKAGDTDLYFDLWDRLTDAREIVAADLIELANEVGCVMVRAIDGLMAKNGRRYYLHPSLYQDGVLQYTGWNQWGPTGHCNIADPEKLESELPDRRFTISWR